MMRRADRSLALVVAVAASLALAGCDSSNDDDGDAGGDTMPTGTGVVELDRGGDLATIVSRGAGDEPFALDAAALDADLSARFGESTDDAIDIEDDEDIDSLVNRRR